MADLPGVRLDVGVGGSAPGGAGADPGTPRGADPGLVEEFRRSLERAPGTDPVAPAPLANPFALLGAQGAAVAAAEGGPAPGDAASNDARLERVQELVARLLVADGAGHGEREVRIRIQDSVLPGTEVRLVHRDGVLQVSFAVADPATLAYLAAQSGMLADELARRLRRQVRVAVNDGRDGEDAARSESRAREWEEATLPAGPAVAGVMPKGPA